MKKVKVKKISDRDLIHYGHEQSKFVVFNSKRFLKIIRKENEEFNFNDKELKKFLKIIKRYGINLFTMMPYSNSSNINMSLFLDYLDAYVKYYNNLCPNAIFLLK